MSCIVKGQSAQAHKSWSYQTDKVQMQIVRINIETFRNHSVDHDDVDGRYRDGGDTEEVGGEARQRGRLDVGQSQVFSEASVTDRHRSWICFEELNPEVYVDVDYDAEEFDDSVSFKIVKKKTF